MEKKRGEGKQRFWKEEQAGSRGGWLKKGGAGTPLRTMEWGVKGQKIVQNDKKFCLLQSIFQEAYIIWLWFLIHMCKMMTYLGTIFIFSKFWFSGSLRVVKGKKWSKMTKTSVHHVSYLRNDTLYDYYLWYTCVKW